MQITLKRKMFPDLKGRAAFIVSPSWFSDGKMAIHRVIIKNEEVLEKLKKLNPHAVVHACSDEMFQGTIDRSTDGRGKEREFRPTPWLREVDVGFNGKVKLVLHRVWKSEDGKQVLIREAYTEQLADAVLFRKGTRDALYSYSRQFVVMPAVGGDDKPPFVGEVRDDCD